MKKNTIKLTIPDSWSDISLKQYQCIYNKTNGLDITDYDNILSYVSIILNIKENTLKEITDEDLNKLINNELKWLGNELEIKQLNEIKIDSETYVYEKDFNSLSLGEMISYETLIEQHHSSYLDCMGYVLGLVLRKKHNNIIEKFDADKIEPYKDKFLKIPITDCIYIINSFFEWRKNILFQYKGLFKPVDEIDEKESLEPNQPVFSDRWKWYSIVEKLAQGDILKFPEIYKQNYISCLNLLSFWHERDSYIRNMERKQKQQQHQTY